ncbi:3-phosphoshikimate 1-carboxyvinyltransferase [Lentibacillus persicus]|uniref:3-phosphoshikimate 1-carboxyvinyltransferase n=1 Tax=Lentibacillus persicus TaxID=640948 RepID=A0A1I2API1_9BACI|nr:3-phosphoshikimate 1-carboxyvinyltransferase [Lentibacillus persicus]SFE45871.1 3-phosphoshikimate 1-carboxyvinyltransferase [Lentibacillus persicus]
MNDVTLKPSQSPLKGSLNVPGDKSISHRAVMLGALANGKTRITNFLTGEDCIRTIEAFEQFGVSIIQDGSTITIESNGSEHFKEPPEPLYFGNSGTTTRLMLGILAGLPFFTTLYGDSSLARRPMDRVVEPLEKMGARLDGRSGGTYLPMGVRGGGLKGIDYTLPVKSAQVKSAVLLAGLFAEGTTRIIERTATRDHSENMLRAFGADLTEANGAIQITNKNSLTGTNVQVPGDISSAAFFITAAAIVPDSRLTLKNVGLNHSRSGIIDVLVQMGASIDITNVQTIGGEKLGDITVTYQKLKATTIEGDIIPRLIDELPIIALAATQAEGTTIIRDAEELRVKETDRIKATTEGLAKLGAKVQPREDGMVITGGATLTGGMTEAYNDHRIAMMLAIASLITKDDVVIDDISSINISYPEFFQDLKTATGNG